MKPIIPALTLSIAAAIAGCNSDGSMRNASNDDANRDTMARTNNVVYDNASATPAPVAEPQLRTGSDKTLASVAKDDQIFLTDATAAGSYEVEASKKALLKSTDDHVKMIAQHMLDDHKHLNDQLSALSQRKGMKLGTLPSPDQIALLSSLDNVNGSDFDREYLMQQRRAHETAISLFQNTAAQSQDRDIRDFAAAMLPTLRGHLEQINDRMNNNIGMEK